MNIFRITKITALMTVAILALSLRAAESQSRLIDLVIEVRDQRGDAIVGAETVVTDAQDVLFQALTDEQGRCRFAKVPVGVYTLKISASGFASHQNEFKLKLEQETNRITVTLFPTLAEKIDVKEDLNRIALDPAKAAGAQILSEQQIKALPDDPDQLLDQLQSLATSSGSAPGGAAVTVDGFPNAGRLPPKSAIREVRINSNIFSAEYDKPPYQGGRIEIYTKPGSDAFHGAAHLNFNDSRFNAREVFAPIKAKTSTLRYGLQFGGPLIRKRAGFLIDFEARDINESATVNAVVLNSTLQPRNFAANLPTPKFLLIGSARTDWQLNADNTFVARYDFNRDRLENQGAGGFDLPERAFDSNLENHSLRLSETAVIGRKIFNEARLAVTRRHLALQPRSNAPAILVFGSFSTGGATAQSHTRDEWSIDATDNLSIVAGLHSLKIGTRVTGDFIDEARSDNFNGTFTFGGGLAPELDSSGRIVTGPDGSILTSISGLEQYRRTLLGLPGGRPTRFSLASGNPLISISQWKLTGFIQDEWRIREDMLLSLGLRYEGQTNPSDRISLGPRIGIAYSPDKKRLWVMRTRAGIFYDRIDEAMVGEARRLDGQRIKQLLIDSSAFPDPFDSGTEIDPIQTTRRIDAEIRPPVSLQTQAGLERQLPRGWKVEMSYYWSRGWAVLRSRNINAPIVEEGDDAIASPRPFGVRENILQFESGGSIDGQVLFIGVNQASNQFFNIFSGYLLFDFQTDADHPFAFPQSSYDLSGERARPSWQARHRAFIVSIFNLPWRVRASSEFNIASGTPFNITTGRDANGDGNFNDRPDPVRAGDPKAVMTPLGAFDISAINGSLGRNAGTSRTTAQLNLNLSRAFNLAKRGTGGEQSIQLALNVRASNLLNRANLYGFNGVIDSAFFGRANSAAPPRRIEMGLRLSF